MKAYIHLISSAFDPKRSFAGCALVSLIRRRYKRYCRDGIEISVDQSFIHEGIEYLLEVDSGNMAKLITGQYILLNCLRRQDEPPSFFIAVHTYKKYNPQRTVSNLNVINRDVLGSKGMPFGVVHSDTLKEGSFRGADGLLDLLVRA